MKRLFLVAVLMLCVHSPVWAIEDTQEIVLQNAAQATGNGTVALVGPYNTIGLDIAISDTATVTFEGRTSNSGTFRSFGCLNAATKAVASTASSSGAFQCNIAGMAEFRARISAYTGGTVTVYGKMSTAVASNGGGGAGGGSSAGSADAVQASDGAGGFADSGCTASSGAMTCTSFTGTVSEADTLDTAFDRGKIIDGANSLANAVRIGDGSTPICLYTDATAGPQVRPCTDANIQTRIPTNFTWALYDEEGTSAIETVDPDAATVQGVWTYASAYRPKKSMYFPAGALHVDGTQCGQPTERTINSGALRLTIICTDNDASTIYGEVEMPDSWDGGTVTLMGSFVQTAADTANLNADVAMACRADGDTINNTWGTEIAMDTAMGGSNKIDTITTAAITPNGTCTGAGTLLQFRWQLDATGTTTAVATLHVLGFKLVYSTKSRSD